MGSLLKTTSTVVVGSFLLLLLLPTVVYCQSSRFVYVDLFRDKNCTSELPFIGYIDNESQANVTFPAFPSNVSETFESAILKNYTGELSLVACQAQLPCNANGAYQISFNLSDIGACSTAGPPGTQFDEFLLSRPSSSNSHGGEIRLLKLTTAVITFLCMAFVSDLNL